MPFKSEAQRTFLWANHPEMAQRWADEYGTPKDLPRHKKKTSRRMALLSQLKKTHG